MPPPAEPVLVASAVHKHYGQTRALQGADLEVRPGELVAVTGPSGSGKSTLLHCLAGLVTPDGGRVLYEGTPLPADSDDRARLRRRHLGLVLQFGQLVPELTALENVAIPLLLEKVDRDDAADRARVWLARLGVEDVTDQRPAAMSGGQAQRVAIARALVAEPRVVLADEPTGALDTVSGELAMDALVGAVRETGAALVLVTHDNRVAAVAEREVTVVDGRTNAWASER